MLDSVISELMERVSKARPLRPVKRMMAFADTKVSVMVDCENVPLSCYQEVMGIADGEGDHVDVRLYGPTALLSKKGWRSLARDGRADSVAFVDVGSGGKNSSDIAIAADATQLAVSGRADTFILVSSDGDFAPLAQRLRAIGCKVCGAGYVGPTASYAPECDSWTRLDLPRGPVGCFGGSEEEERSGDITGILSGCVAACAGDDGWSDLSDVGMKVRLALPDFNAKDFGSPTLKELIRSTGKFDLLHTDNRWMARVR